MPVYDKHTGTGSSGAYPGDLGGNTSTIMMCVECGKEEIPSMYVST